MKKILTLLATAKPNIDLGLLAFRLLAVISLLKAHGLPKLLNIQETMADNPDPIGFGPVFSTYYALFTNVLCALFVAFGFMTRISALFIISLTLSGLFLVHLHDSAHVQDTPLIYSIVFGIIAYMGAGKQSLDQKIFTKC